MKHGKPVWRSVTVALFGALLLAGCSGVNRTATAPPGRPEFLWPPPPEVPRIAYRQSVTRPADLGVRRSGFTRFSQWLTGSEKGNERLVKPFGLALDESDNLLITDTGLNTVCYFERKPRKWHRWNKAGRLRFASPVAVAKQGGTIYVADSAIPAVIAMDTNARLLFTITNRLQRPAGLAVGSNTLYVTDSQRHCVVAFDLRGQFLREIGKRGVGPGEFNFPTHAATDRQGRLYVTDSMNSRVQLLDPDGAPLAVLGQRGDSPGQFSRPKGLAVDGDGHVYVVDAVFENVQIFSDAGQLLLNFGTEGSGPGEFWLPNGIAISADEQIYVADTYNCRVQVFKYIGPP